MTADVARAVRAATSSTKTTYRLKTNGSDESWQISGGGAERMLPSGINSNYLVFRDFDFDLPETSTIDGLQFTVSRSGSADLYDNAVRLYASGHVFATDKSLNAAWLTEGSGAVYGSSSDVSWGTSLTPELVNKTEFGLALQITNNNASGTVGYVYDASCIASYSFGETNEGNAVIYTNPFNRTKRVVPTVRHKAGWVHLSGLLHDRLDDVDYYTT